MSTVEDTPALVPFEDHSLPWLRRFGATLRGALHPFRSALSFRGSELRAPLLFAMLTAVPLVLLRGVIPFTQTILFAPGFGLQLLPVIGDREPSALEITLDVMRAMGMSLGLGVLFLSALALPFLSLTRAYGEAEAASAARRFVLYRCWLLAVALQGLPIQLIAWGTPESLQSSGFALVFFAIDLVPLLLFAQGMQSTVRIACGLRALPAFAATVIPLLVAILSVAIAGNLLPEHWLSPPTTAP